MMKSSYLFLLSFLLAASHLATASKPSTVGGWVPIKNLTDQHVKDLGAFAVSEHNKNESDTLVFVKVVKGATQVVAGTNYKLLLEAKNADGAVAKYEAIVWEKVWQNFKQLTSFKSASS